MLSDSVKIAAIQFPMPKNISRRKKLGDKLWQNNEKKNNFWFLNFFSKFFKNWKTCFQKASSEVL